MKRGRANRSTYHLYRRSPSRWATGSHVAQTSKFFDVLGSEILASIADNNVDRLRAIVDDYLPTPSDISRLCAVRGSQGRTGVSIEPPACPLLTAVELPDTAILTYLIDSCGFDPNHQHIISTANSKPTGNKNRQTTALHNAVCCRSIDAVETLLDAGADPNVVDGDGRTPLRLAVSRADCDLVRLLLKRGADRTSRDPNTGNTALHEAAALGHGQLARTLIDERRPVSVSQPQQPLLPSNTGALPVHVAASAGHVHLVQLFCSLDSSSANARTSKQPTEESTGENSGGNKNGRVPLVDGRTPLHVAAERGHVETVLALVDLFSADVNANDSAGDSALHAVVSRRHRDGVDRPTEFYEVTAQTLIKYGIDAARRNAKGESAYDMATKNEWAKIAEMLQSLETSSVNKSGQSSTQRKSDDDREGSGGGKSATGGSTNKTDVKPNKSSAQASSVERSNAASTGRQAPGPIPVMAVSLPSTTSSPAPRSVAGSVTQPEMNTGSNDVETVTQPEIVEEDGDDWPPPPPPPLLTAENYAVKSADERLPSVSVAASFPPKTEGKQLPETGQGKPAAAPTATNNPGNDVNDDVNGPQLKLMIAGDTPKAHTRYETESARTAFILSRPVGLERPVDHPSVYKTNDQVPKTSSNPADRRSPTFIGDGDKHNALDVKQEQKIVAADAHRLSGLSAAVPEVNGDNIKHRAGLSTLLIMQPTPYKSFGSIEPRIDAIKATTKHVDDYTSLNDDREDSMLRADIDEDWNDEDDDSGSNVEELPETVVKESLTGPKTGQLVSQNPQPGQPGGQKTPANLAPVSTKRNPMSLTARMPQVNTKLPVVLSSTVTNHHVREVQKATVEDLTSDDDNEAGESSFFDEDFGSEPTTIVDKVSKETKPKLSEKCNVNELVQKIGAPVVEVTVDKLQNLVVNPHQPRINPEKSAELAHIEVGMTSKAKSPAVASSVGSQRTRTSPQSALLLELRTQPAEKQPVKYFGQVGMLRPMSPLKVDDNGSEDPESVDSDELLQAMSMDEPVIRPSEECALRLINGTVSLSASHHVPEADDAVPITDVPELVALVKGGANKKKKKKTHREDNEIKPDTDEERSSVATAFISEEQSLPVVDCTNGRADGVEDKQIKRKIRATKKDISYEIPDEISDEISVEIRDEISDEIPDGVLENVSEIHSRSDEKFGVGRKTRTKKVRPPSDSGNQSEHIQSADGDEDVAEPPTVVLLQTLETIATINSDDVASPGKKSGVRKKKKTPETAVFGNDDGFAVMDEPNVFEYSVPEVDADETAPATNKKSTGRKKLRSRSSSRNRLDGEVVQSTDDTYELVENSEPISVDHVVDHVISEVNARTSSSSRKKLRSRSSSRNQLDKDLSLSVDNNIEHAEIVDPLTTANDVPEDDDGVVGAASGVESRASAKKRLRSRSSSRTRRGNELTLAEQNLDNYEIPDAVPQPPPVDQPDVVNVDDTAELVGDRKHKKSKKAHQQADNPEPDDQDQSTAVDSVAIPDEDNNKAATKSTRKKKLHSRSSSRTHLEPEMSVDEVVDPELRTPTVECEPLPPTTPTPYDETVINKKSSRKLIRPKKEHGELSAAGGQPDIVDRESTGYDKEFTEEISMEVVNDVIADDTAKKPPGRRMIRSRSGSRNQNVPNAPVTQTEDLIPTPTSGLYDDRSGPIENEADTSFSRKPGRVSVRRRKQQRHPNTDDNSSTMDVSQELIEDPLQITFDAETSTTAIDVGDIPSKRKPPTGKKSTQRQPSSESQGRQSEDHIRHEVDDHDDDDVSGGRDGSSAAATSGASKIQMPSIEDEERDENFERKKERVSERRRRRQNQHHDDDDKPTDDVHVEQSPVDVAHSPTAEDGPVPVSEDGLRTKQSGRRRLLSRSNSRTKADPSALRASDDSRYPDTGDVIVADPVTAIGDKKGNVGSDDTPEVRGKPRKRMVRSRSSSRCRHEQGPTHSGEPDDDAELDNGNVPETSGVVEHTDTKTERGTGRRKVLKKSVTGSRQEPSFDAELNDAIEESATQVAEDNNGKPIIAEVPSKKTKQKKVFGVVAPTEADDDVAMTQPGSGSGDVEDVDEKEVVMRKPKNKKDSHRETEHSDAVPKAMEASGFTNELFTQDQLDETDAAEVDNPPRRPLKKKKSKDKSNSNNNNLSKDTSVDDLISNFLKTSRTPHLEEGELHPRRSDDNTEDIRESSEVPPKNKKIKAKSDKKRPALNHEEEDGETNDAIETAEPMELDVSSFNPMEADLDSYVTSCPLGNEAPSDHRSNLSTVPVPTNEVTHNDAKRVAQLQQPRRSELVASKAPVAPRTVGLKAKKSRARARDTAALKVNRSMSYMETSFDDCEPVMTSETVLPPEKVERSSGHRRRLRPVPPSMNRSLDTALDEPIGGSRPIVPAFAVADSKTRNVAPARTDNIPQPTTPLASVEPETIETSSTSSESVNNLQTDNGFIAVRSSQPVNIAAALPDVVGSPSKSSSHLGARNDDGTDSDRCPEPVFQRRQPKRASFGWGSARSKSGDAVTGVIRNQDDVEKQPRTEEKRNSGSGSSEKISTDSASSNESLQPTDQAVIVRPKSTSGSAFRPVGRQSLSFEAVPRPIGSEPLVSPATPEADKSSASMVLPNGIVEDDVVTSSPLSLASPPSTSSDVWPPQTMNIDKDPDDFELVMRNSRPVERTASGLSARSLSLGAAVSLNRRSSGNDKPNQIKPVPNRTPSSAVGVHSSLSNRQRRSRQAKSAVVAAAEARQAKLLRPIEVKEPELSLQDAAFEMLSGGMDWDAPKPHLSNGNASKPSYERNNNYGDSQPYTRGPYRSDQPYTVARRPSASSSSTAPPSATDSNVVAPTTRDHVVVTRRRVPRLAASTSLDVGKSESAVV